MESHVRWPAREGDSLGQVPLKPYRARRPQGQPQLWFYRAFERAGTDPAWPVVRDIVHFNRQSLLQQFLGRTHRESLSTPAPPFPLHRSSPLPLSFLPSRFSSFTFSLPFHESWYKFQSKIKMYFISPFSLWLSSVHSKDIGVSMGTNTLSSRGGRQCRKVESRQRGLLRLLFTCSRRNRIMESRGCRRIYKVTKWYAYLQESQWNNSGDKQMSFI